MAPVLKLYTGVTHEYATMYPGNINHQYFLLQHPHGFIGLHDATGSLIKILPAFVNSSSQPRWCRNRKKPNIFRYLYLNELREFDVVTGQSTLIRKFTDLPNINGMGESDTSEDDNYILLCSGGYIFVYNMLTDRVTSEFHTPDAFNNLYLTSDNLPIIGFYGRGVTLREPGGYYRTLTTKLCHMDTSSDANSNPIMVWADGTRDKGYVVKTDLNDGTRTDLWSFPWSLAVHISLPDRAKFCDVTAYDPKDPTNPGNEIVRVWLDSVNGSHVEHLVKHGSNVSAGKTDIERYLLQPKASVSPDGSRIVYDSNGSVYLSTLDSPTPIEEPVPMSNSAGITNSGVWSASFVKQAEVLDQPNMQTVETIQAVVPYLGNGSSTYIVKQGLHVEIVTYDNHPSGRDALAINGVSIIAPGNLKGGAFAFTAIARVGMPPSANMPPADGYAVGIEADVENYGVDQPDPDRTNSKYGFKAISRGSTNSTVAFEARGHDGPHGIARWWRVLFSTIHDIAAGGKFIDLYDRFTVDGEGRVTLRNQSPPPPPQDGVTLFAQDGQLKAMKSNGQVIIYG